MPISLESFQKSYDQNRNKVGEMYALLETARTEMFRAGVTVDPHVGEALNSLQAHLAVFIDQKNRNANPNSSHGQYLQACLDSFSEVGNILNTPVCEGGESILDYAKKGMTPEKIREVTGDFETGFGVQVANQPPLPQGMSFNEYVTNMYSRPEMSEGLKKMYNSAGPMIHKAMQSRPGEFTAEEAAKMHMTFTELGSGKARRPYGMTWQTDGETHQFQTGTEDQLKDMNGLGRLLDRRPPEEAGGLRRSLADDAVTLEAGDGFDDQTMEKRRACRAQFGMLEAAHHLPEAHGHLINPGTEIRKWQQKLTPEMKNSLRAGDEEAEEQVVQSVAAILAIRAQAEARKGANLSAQTQSSIKAGGTWLHQAKLADDPLVGKFVTTLRDKTKAFDWAKEGYGDKLDEKFRQYLLKCPAGKLPNDPKFARWMPTVRQRIDFLKEQIRNGGENVDVPRAAAEIVVLRNLAHAHRGKKSSLDVKIPTDTANTLTRMTSSMAVDPGFRDLCEHPEIREQMTEGHGGAMLDLMRENVPNNMYPRTRNMLMQNTYAGRVYEIQTQAKILKKRLEGLDKEAYGYQNALDAINRDYKKMMCESMAIDETMRRNHQGLNDNLYRLDVDKRTAQLDSDRTVMRNTGIADQERILKGLTKMAGQSNSAFVKELRENTLYQDPPQAAGPQPGLN